MEWILGKKGKVEKTTEFVESKNDLGRSRSSIKKSIREDEMISRQKKKRNRSMEEER